MYVNNDAGYYGGLEEVWGGDNGDKPIVDPRTYIPKKTDIINADQASLYLQKPSERKLSKIQKQKEGGVYWTDRGPTYATKKIKTGKKAEKVPAPKIKFRPDVKVLRDLPKLSLPPIQKPPLPKPKTMQGFANVGENKLPLLVVLSLLIVGLVLYNRP